MEEKRREQRRLMWMIPVGVAVLILALLLTALASGVFAPRGGGRSTGKTPEPTPDEGTPTAGVASGAAAPRDATPQPGEETPAEAITADRAEATAPTPAEATTPVAAAREGTLVVRCIPWANVQVDGRNLGRTPVTHRIKAGRHKLEASNPELGWTHTQWVTVEAGEASEVNLKAERSAIAPPG